LNNGILNRTEIQITAKATIDYNLSILPQTSVCIAMYGGAGTIGKHCILHFNTTINQSVCAIQPNGFCNMDYIHTFIEYQRPFWMDFAAGSRKDPNINQLIIKHCLLPIPPQEEQRRIVTKLNQLYPYINQYGNSQNRLNQINKEIWHNLKKSILQEAIQGKLVPQIAEEGIAQDLLEQIRQEKQKLVKEGKLKKSALTDSVIYKGDDNKYYEQIDKENKEITEDILFDLPNKWQWCRIGTIFMHNNNNIFTVILGKFYSGQEVGYFTQANKWNYMGHSLISGTVNSVAQPVLSSLSDERERQQRAFRKMLRFTAFISFPAMLGLSLIAPELIILTITDKWLPSAFILQLLCIGGAFIPITNLYSNLVISKGKSDIYMWNTISLGIIQLTTMLLLYPYGVHTMIIVYVSINICWLFVWHYFVWKQIRLSLFAALKDILPFAFIATAVMAATYYITIGFANLYLLMASKMIIAGTLYTAILWLSGSVTFKESLHYIIKK
jgi:restriction endonuclease S subunit